MPSVDALQSTQPPPPTSTAAPPAPATVEVAPSSVVPLSPFDLALESRRLARFSR
jgi:hypothetical protein